jgi:hypothetical protein
MNNWCICWVSTYNFTGILIFKGLTARRLYKSFGVKGLIVTTKFAEKHYTDIYMLLHYLTSSEVLPTINRFKRTKIRRFGSINRYKRTKIRRFGRSSTFIRYDTKVKCLNVWIIFNIDIAYTQARYTELSLRETAALKFDFRYWQNCHVLYRRNPQQQ